jgi:hypothetical protein
MVIVENHQGKEVLIIDFSNCKSEQMIDMLTEARDKVIREKTLRLMLAIFNDKSFITPNFLHHFNSYKREEVIPFILKQALVGLSEPKKIIVKGINFLSNRNMVIFDSKREAIEYLVADLG